MDEPAASPPLAEDGPSLEWKPSGRTRKSGCSNIFAGVNLRQLRRLFHVAGEGDAEQRAQLVWGRGGAGRGGGGGGGGEEEEAGGGENGEEVEAGLAKALVGLRVRARRTRAGLRAEGQRDPTWLRAFGHLRIKEQKTGSEALEEEDKEPGSGESPTQAVDRIPAGPSSQRPGPARPEGPRDSERYLHRILH